MSSTSSSATATRPFSFMTSSTGSATAVSKSCGTSRTAGSCANRESGARQMTSTLMNTGIGEQSHVFTLNPAYDYPVLERGEGVYVYDTEGRQYLDAVAGIALASIGYGRQRVADVLARQAAKL